MYFTDTEVENYYSVSRYTIWRWECQIGRNQNCRPVISESNILLR